MGDYDFDSEKKLNIVRVSTAPVSKKNQLVFDGPTFPMDSEAEVAYYSRMGGFVPIDVAMDTIFTNPPHYGAGGFEGVRLQRTRYGDGFVELPFNLARLVYSSMSYDLSLFTETQKKINKPEVDHIEHLQRTPRGFFEDSILSLEESRDIRMGLQIFYNDGSVRNTSVPFNMRVRFSDYEGAFKKQEDTFSLKEFEAMMCSLAILNKLVRGGKYPANEVGLIPGGYFRPFFWVSGEEGLKVPTAYKKDGEILFRSKYLGAGTLPWGPYLEEEGYKTGLKLLIGPYPRIDAAMPVWQKIAGDYVNSARNINVAMVLGFQEILACNHNDELVEGSAENIVFLLTQKNTGKLRALFPPLSSNILAGTTRDRVQRILEQGIHVQGKPVELVLEAPKKQFILECLEGKTDWDVSAIMLMGTGVGLIHARSLTYNPALKEWLEVNELRSEETGSVPLKLKKLRETEQSYEINGGVEHPFVSALKQAYSSFVLSAGGTRITPPYDMDYDTAARIFGVGLEEVAGPELRSEIRNGYFKERINGVEHPDEIKARYQKIIPLIRKMNEISISKRSRPLVSLLNR